jgi:hypothetical protein
MDFLGYFLLSLISTFVFRAIRDTLPNNPMAQERILGAAFLALGIADVCDDPAFMNVTNLTDD